MVSEVQPISTYKNGKMMEDFVTSLFPDIKMKNELIDAEYGTVQVEIKSCQEFIVDNSHNTAMKRDYRRSGRFVFEGEQHRELVELGGEYFFIVHSNGVPKMFIRVDAEQVGLPDHFRGTKSVTWKTIVKRVM